MPASRRPDGGRRAAARSAARARRPAAPAAPTTPTPRRTTGQPALSRAGLTTRAAVLGLVVCALVVSAALPLRDYLAQRSAIADADAAMAAAEARVAALEAEKARLQDPAQVAAEARRRLHFVRPGEIAYTLVLPTPAPTAGPGPDGAASTDDGADAPWYSQLYGTVRAADTAPVR